MPALVLTAEAVAAHVVPVASPPMPVMAAPMRSVPVAPVLAMPSPVMAASVPSVRVARPRMVLSPVMPVPRVLVPVMRRLDPGACGSQPGHDDEKGRAGCEESEELIP